MTSFAHSRNRIFRKKRDTGTALIATVLILTILLALGAAMTVAIVGDTGLRNAYQSATTGFYAAESGLDRGMGGYRDIFLNFQVPQSSDFQQQTVNVGTRTVNYQLSDVNPTPGVPTTVQIPYGQPFGGLNSSQYTYTVYSSSVNKFGDTEASVGAEFQVGYIPLFQFVAFYANDLEIDPGATMNLNGRVHTNANLYLGPDANLTISTNPAMGVNYVQVTAEGSIERGRKDTGACNTSPTLQVDTASNNLQTLACIGSSTTVITPSSLATWGGTMLANISRISVPPPSITTRGSGDYWNKADLRIALVLNSQWAIPAYNYQTGPTLTWPAVTLPHSIVALDQYGNVDATKTALLLSFLRSYKPGGTAPAGSQFPLTRPLFYTDVPTSGANCTCTNANPAGGGTGCTTATTGNATGNTNCYSTAFSSANRIYASDMTGDQDFRRGGFYNWREGKWMYLLNINVADLLQWNMNQASGSQLFSPSDNTDGGIVLYATVYDANSPNATSSNNFEYGVRVFGSRTLPFPALATLGNDPTGITVVSDRSMYVLGDYNAPPGAGGVFTPANLWQPSSLVGDSVNVMSNSMFSWNAAAGTCVNDCQSNRSLDDNSRNASTTTINAAFLAGVDTTSSGNYNGGLENYPRFHEDWGGQTFNYLGSFVSLGTPTSVSGSWCGTGGTYVGAPPTKSGCNIYNPPARAWNFDPNFQNAAYLPPLTPRFVYVQQIRFTENFK